MPQKGDSSSNFKMKPEIILIGDSILDNNYWVAQGEDVPSLLSRCLPELEVRNLAVDGFTTHHVLKGAYKDVAVQSASHTHTMFKPLKQLNHLAHAKYIVL
ncbi:MAG: hypothetical protein PSV35_05815, partial [bacterium]|nr:hypothetical protein [bacterium]